jgi:hypothetical protein
MNDYVNRRNSFEYWLKTQISDIQLLSREEYQSHYNHWYHSVYVSKITNL